MKTQMTVLTTAVATICGLTSYTTMAATPVNDDILTIDAGVPEIFPLYGTIIDVTSGSYFGMDTNGDAKIQGTEKTPISQGTTGITIGVTTSPGASHTGAPTAGDTNEIDAPWSFFGNTGSHYVTVPVSGDTTNGLNFSGWTVTWNAIAAIAMGNRAWQPGNCADLSCSGVTFADGTAAFSWSGVYFDPYVLQYTATVPSGDPSGFGDVRYYLRIEGIVVPGTPTKQVAIALPGGDTQECSETGGSVVAASADITTNNPADIVAVNWTLDGTHAGSGEMVDIFTPLGTHTLGVVVDTAASGTFESTAPVTITDSIAPMLDIIFTDPSTGMAITEVSDKGKQSVGVHYDVTDVCDPAPTAGGVATSSDVVENGATMEIFKGQLVSTVINVSADAVDASGNTAHQNAALPVVE